MSHLPSAVDALIWKLAESDDMAAHADFVSQYPELKDELSRRAALVQRLRSYPRVQSRLPRFTPTAEPTTPPTQRWLVPAAATLVLGGLAFATFAVVNYVRSSQAPEPAVQSPSPAPSAPRTTAPQSGRASVPQTSVPSGQTPPVNAAPAQESTRWDTPVTLEAKDATLSAVVLAIASGAHVSIKLAPGMPNPTVSLTVSRKRAGTVLEELGKKYGFGVLYETDSHAVLIPLSPIPGDATPAPDNSGKRAEDQRSRAGGDTLPAAPKPTNP